MFQPFEKKKKTISSSKTSFYLGAFSLVERKLKTLFTLVCRTTNRCRDTLHGSMRKSRRFVISVCSSVVEKDQCLIVVYKKRYRSIVLRSANAIHRHRTISTGLSRKRTNRHGRKTIFLSTRRLSPICCVESNFSRVKSIESKKSKSERPTGSNKCRRTVPPSNNDKDSRATVLIVIDRRPTTKSKPSRIDRTVDKDFST